MYTLDFGIHTAFHEFENHDVVSFLQHHLNETLKSLMYGTLCTNHARLLQSGTDTVCFICENSIDMM